MKKQHLYWIWLGLYGLCAGLGFIPAPEGALKWLLVALALHPGQVLTRHDLITEVWDTTWVGDERIVDVHIGNLRRKLGTDTRGRGFIDTVRGVGYRVGQP